MNKWIVLIFFLVMMNEGFMQDSLNEKATEQAWRVLQQLRADEQERLEAEATEKARRDFISRIRAAKRGGREEGRKERDVELRIELAIKMMNSNKPIEEILEFTGLSSEEILEITSNNNINYKFNA